ncbi:MAG: hypothetical protein V3T40_02675 [Nitrososphaerales archaeon]
MRRVRACPLCPECGSKKFQIITNEGEKVVVQCKKCSKRLTI